jgi:hypothetical protein
MATLMMALLRPVSAILFRSEDNSHWHMSWATPVTSFIVTMQEISWNRLGAEGKAPHSLAEGCPAVKLAVAML